MGARQYGIKSFLVALVLTGCASGPTSEPAIPQTQAPVGQESGGSSAPPPPANGAARSLLQRAEQERRDGDFEQALSLLERAQRIAPNDAAVYLETANVYADRGDTERARASAERGLLYCSEASTCKALRRHIP